jgi:hypothetical protein
MAIVVPIYKGGDRSLVSNYRPISLTSEVCKQMERVITSYLRKIWDNKDSLFEGQHEFGLGYSCESQVIMVCQDIADSLDNGGRIDAIIIDFSKAYVRSTAKKCTGSSTIPRVRIWYLEKH